MHIKGLPYAQRSAPQAGERGVHGSPSRFAPFTAMVGLRFSSYSSTGGEPGKRPFFFVTGSEVRTSNNVKEAIPVTRLKIGGAFLSSVLSVLGLALAGPASAHHSVQAEFDINKTITVVGTVAKVEWINPHSYLTVEAKDADGKVQRWGFELGGPGALRRAGMSRADRGGLKPGDEVTITALAAKDGSSNGFLRELKLTDGRVFKFGIDPNGN
jgi:Family of unknown function (DUF6152)